MPVIFSRVLYNFIGFTDFSLFHFFKNYVENEIKFFFSKSLSSVLEHFDFPRRFFEPPYKHTKAAILIATNKKQQ